MNHDNNNPYGGGQGQGGSGSDGGGRNKRPGPGKQRRQNFNNNNRRQFNHPYNNNNNNNGHGMQQMAIQGQGGQGHANGNGFRNDNNRGGGGRVFNYYNNRRNKPAFGGVNGGGARNGHNENWNTDRVNWNGRFLAGPEQAFHHQQQPNHHNHTNTNVNNFDNNRGNSVSGGQMIRQRRNMMSYANNNNNNNNFNNNNGQQQRQNSRFPMQRTFHGNAATRNYHNGQDQPSFASFLQPNFGFEYGRNEIGRRVFLENRTWEGRFYEKLASYGFFKGCLKYARASSDDEETEFVSFNIQYFRNAIRKEIAGGYFDNEKLAREDAFEKAYNSLFLDLEPTRLNGDSATSKFVPLFAQISAAVKKTFNIY